LCHERLEFRKAKTVWISFSFTEEFFVSAHGVTIYSYKKMSTFLRPPAGPRKAFCTEREKRR
jgi:hypothetical protein